METKKERTTPDQANQNDTPLGGAEKWEKEALEGVAEGKDAEYRFHFSIIMAVYNVEAFIREAIDSVIEQNIGFDKVQLILVDDGTPDESGRICEEYRAAYPENIVVIHKENGGQASARNEGLKYAEGRLINFMDPDDKLSRNTLSNVYAFYEKHSEETDMVAIPMYFFDGKTGEHWQNTKFKKGNRVIYLRNESEYKTYQASASSSFYSAQVKDLLEFDTVLPCSEDFKVTLRVLAEKCTLGVVSNCKYFYRRRSEGAISTMQGLTANRKWYFEWFENLCDWACDFYRQRFGYLPAFVQYSILCDILWRYQTDNSLVMEQVLTEEERERHVECLKRALRNFEDRYIMDLPILHVGLKSLMLTHKYGRYPELMRSGPMGGMLRFGNTTIMNLGSMSTQIAFLSIKGNTLVLEGSTNVIGLPEDEEVTVSLLVNGEEIPCTVIDRPELTLRRFGTAYLKGVGFRCELTLDPAVAQYAVKVVCGVRGVSILKRTLDFGRFAPVAGRLKQSYYERDSWRVTHAGEAIRIVPCQPDRLFKESERNFLKELWKQNEPGMRKAVVARTAYRGMKRFKKKKIWLISDRVTRAGDNGEAFFEYLCAKKPGDVQAYFVIDRNSPDYEKMKKIGPVVEYMSKKHKFLHLLADCIISSAAEAAVTNPYGVPGQYYKDILAEQKFVFLQHGVTKDDQSAWLGRYNKGIDGLVTSSPEEYRSMVEGEGYHYDAENIWLTGMPRFDRLYRDSKRKITIMPTWRQYLMTKYNAASGQWEVDGRFPESDYFQFYSALLKDRRLIDAANQYGYTIQFYPHPNIMQHIELFEADPAIQILNEEMEYRTVYAETDLIITDYSSAVFDFAYLYQPIIYAHFDAEQFFSGSHVYKKGYFDYERDGFGEVEYDLEAVVDRTIEYMKNDCQMKPIYRERVDRFFAFRDQKNCERVFEKIMNMKD